MTLRAKVSYIIPALRDEELYVYKYELPEDVCIPTNLDFHEVEVPIADLRTAENRSLTLERNGFQLESFRIPGDIDWRNDLDVSMVYARNWTHAYACTGP